MSTPRITIVLPVHNGGEYLKLCVRSIQAQTCPDFVLAALENASTDGSAEWVRSLGDPRIKIYPTGSLVPWFQNYQRALEIVDTEFMVFLGHDDLLCPEYVATMTDMMARYPEAGLYNTLYAGIDARGRFLRACPTAPEHETADDYLRRVLLGSPHYYVGTLYRSALYREVGGFPEFESGFYCDPALTVVYALRTATVATAQRVLFLQRQHTSSFSRSAGWLPQAQAMVDYYRFLKQTRDRDARFAAIFDELGASYCYRLASTNYRIALREASRGNRPLDPRVGQLIESALGEIAPDRVAELRHSPEVRRWIRINRRPVQRTVYRAYQASRTTLKALGSRLRRPVEAARGAAS